MKLLFILFSAMAGLFSFPQITSAVTTAGLYTALTASVRDFYSKEVLYVAQPKCKFLQFAKVKRDLTAIKGKAIVFTKFGNLSGGGAIAENAAFTPQVMTDSTVTITVSEQMNGVQITELLMRTSLHDVLGEASILLSDNVAKVLDGQFRDTAIATTNIVYGNGAANPAAMTNASVFNSVTVKDVVELLETNNAPKFEAEYYVCFAHPKQLRQLRDDPNWINANTYMGRRNLYTGEVGMYEGVIFISTTQMPKLNNADMVTKYGSYSPAFGLEAVIFGENSYGWAIALDVELRDDGVVELGRKHTLGWYGIWGTGIIEEDNIVRVVTASAT